MPANVFAIVSCQIAQILALESRLQRRRRDTRIGRPQPHPFSSAHVAPPGASDNSEPELCRCRT